jgi:hypothetical protein
MSSKPKQKKLPEQLDFYSNRKTKKQVLNKILE